jgi:hypothetical protein
MSTTTITPITNAEILWKLIQGQQAIDWAKTKVGWNTGSSTNDDGTCGCLSFFYELINIIVLVLQS